MFGLFVRVVFVDISSQEVDEHLQLGICDVTDAPF